MTKLQKEKKVRVSYTLTPTAVDMLMEQRAVEYTSASAILEKAIREYVKNHKEERDT